MSRAPTEAERQALPYRPCVGVMLMNPAGRVFAGQRQRWFLLRFLGDDGLVRIDGETPEFGAWTWLDPKELPERIVPFKRETYLAVHPAFAGRLG